MGCLMVVPLTAIVIVIGAGMSALTGLFMALGAIMATSMTWFIAFLIFLI
jgi:hypothetical protein